MSDQTITFSERDEIDRKKMAERIIEEIRDNNEITPLLIHGRWGNDSAHDIYNMLNRHKQNYGTSPERYFLNFLKTLFLHE